MLPIQIIPPDRDVIRFGMGWGRDAVSPLWRIWVRGDEVYLAVRDVSGISKISLHSNGNWQFNAGSLMRRLVGPTSHANGWQRGPTIDTPILPDTEAPPSPNERPRKQFLVRPPPIGSKVAFTIYFAVGTPPREEVCSTFPDADGIVGPLLLRSGDTAWLVATVIRMVEKEVNEMVEQRDGMRVTMAGSVTSPPSAWIMHMFDLLRVGTFIRHYTLRRRNFARTT